MPTALVNDGFVITGTYKPKGPHHLKVRAGQRLYGKPEDILYTARRQPIEGSVLLSIDTNFLRPFELAALAGQPLGALSFPQLYGSSCHRTDGEPTPPNLAYIDFKHGGRRTRIIPANWANAYLKWIQDQPIREEREDEYEVEWLGSIPEDELSIVGTLDPKGPHKLKIRIGKPYQEHKHCVRLSQPIKGEIKFLLDTNFLTPAWLAALAGHGFQTMLKRCVAMQHMPDRLRMYPNELSVACLLFGHSTNLIPAHHAIGYLKKVGR